MPTEKLPPYDTDAEEAVVGSLMLDGAAISQVAAWLKPQHFFREKNGWIYQSMLTLYQAGSGIDQITVATQLSLEDKLSGIGGPQYLIHILSVVPTSLHLEHYAQIVLQKAQARHIISLAGRIAAMGYAEQQDAIQNSIKLLLSCEPTKQRDVLSPADTADIAMALFAGLNSGTTPTLQHGLTAVDSATGGLRPGELTIIGARPHMGKTTVLQHIAHHNATQGKIVLFASVEMSIDGIIMRNVARSTGVKIRQLYKSSEVIANWDKIQDSIGQLGQQSIWYRAGRGLTIPTLNLCAQQIIGRVGKLDLILVDYLQIMKGEGQNTNDKIGSLTAGLKTIAQELSIPVICASQLNRGVEYRDNKRPMLADLRDSGNIEQDADVILLMYRDDYYYSEEDFYKVCSDEPYPRGTVEFGLAKHRQFGTDSSQVVFEHWDKDHNLFIVTP